MGPPASDGSPGFWPRDEAWTDVSGRDQFTDGSALCTRIVVCDEGGSPTNRFRQGEQAHFFVEFQVLKPLDVPFGTLEINDASGLLVHGKALYQSASERPRAARSGELFRLRWTVALRLLPGFYRFTVQLAETTPENYSGYSTGPLGYRDFIPGVTKHCRLEGAGTFELSFGQGDKLLHHGVADLSGSVEAELSGAPSTHAAQESPRAVPDSEGPTVFHVTHWKAGSQWIHKILVDCCPDRLVKPEVDILLRYPVRRGGVYPTVYMSKPAFDRVALPPDSRRFVVIRDLRDTLVSAYFSFKISHPLIPGFPLDLRRILQESEQDAGLIFLMDHFLEQCAAIQLSWLEADGELILKYEDLLTNDEAMLAHALIQHCRLPISTRVLKRAVQAARFEALTGGRPRGREDLSAHERKGVAGDWRNHFSEPVKRAFKARYGGLLFAAGYESGLTW